MGLTKSVLKILCLCDPGGLKPSTLALLQKGEFLFELTQTGGFADFRKKAAGGVFDAALVDFSALLTREKERLVFLRKVNPLVPLVLLVSKEEERQARKLLGEGIIRDYVLKSAAQLEKLPYALKSAAMWGDGIALKKQAHHDLKQAAVLQDAVFRIAHAADLAASLDELFRRIHSIISDVMPAENFYVALNSPRKGFVTYPYFVDQEEERPWGEKAENGLTEYVLKSGRSLLCDADAQIKMTQKGLVNSVGPPSKIWLGVPLVVDGEVIGVMAVQHYQDPHAYGQHEQHIFEFISSQVALVIRRKKAEDALRASEEGFRSLFENATVGMVRTTPDGRILLANSALIKMLRFDSLEDFQKRDLQKNGFTETYPRSEFLRRVEETGMLKGYETTWVCKDGSYIHVRESSRAVRDSNGRTLYYEVLVEDITAQKQAMDSLQEKIAALQALTKIDKDILAVRRPAEIMELVCRSAASLLNCPMAAIVSTQTGHWSLEATTGIQFPEQMAAELLKTVSDSKFHHTPHFGIADIFKAPHMPDSMAREGIRSMLGEVLSAGGREQGVLLVFDQSPRTWTGDEVSLLKTLAGQTAIALDKARLLADSQRRAGEFAALHAISVELAVERDLEMILSRIVKSIRQLMDVPSAFIYLYDDRSETLVLSISEGKGLPKGLTLKLGEGMAGRVAETRKPLMVQHYREWAERVLGLDRINYSAVLEVPMLFGGMLIGVLGVAEIDNNARIFMDQDEKLLSLFAAQGASAVYNARLFDAIQRNNEELDRLYHASDSLIGSVSSNILEISLKITEIVVSEFNYSNCSLWLLGEDLHSLRRMAIAGADISEFVLHPLTLDGAGLISKAIRSGRPVNVPDVRLDPDYLEGWSSACSELVLPLKSGERVIGALDLQSAVPSAFRDDEVRVLFQFSSRAGLMLEHTRLVSETEQRLRRLSALHTVDIAVASSLDLQVTLKVFLEQVTSHLHVDAAGVFLLNPYLQVLEYASGRGFRGAGIRRTSLRVGEDAAGQAALERAMVGIPRLNLSAGEIVHPDRIAGEGFVSAYAVPLIARGKMKGVLELYFRNEFTADIEWRNFVETLARQAAVAIDDAHLFEQLQRSYTELSVAYNSTIEGWARLLELRLAEPRDHSDYVTGMVMELSRRMGIPEQELTHVYRGALLHDIGKLAIPDSILLKPGRLTEAEWEIVRTHPVLARDMLVSIDYLRPAAVIPYAHHEKWDGSGYPRGLKAEQIPIAARIFSVVDVWYALKRDQPYRPAWSEEDATDYIRQNAGRDFEPSVVEAFLAFLADERKQTGREG